MPEQPPRTLHRAASGLGRLRDRVTRTGSAARSEPAGGPGHSDLDRWLVPLFGAGLTELEDSIKGKGAEAYREFRPLDDDLWALLLTLEYESFPGIRAFLPGLPDPATQQMWNGASGPGLAAQSVCFYRKLKEVQGRFGDRELASSKVLDVGCGWGRMTRMLARDVDPGNLFGCDPVEEILESCRKNRVPATFARSDFLPETLPFEEKFDLVFAFSVLTHISETAARALAGAISRSLEPGGLFVFTIRPPAYLDLVPAMAAPLEATGVHREDLGTEPAFVFLPHPDEDHPQYDGGEMSYGETMINLPWIRQNWNEEFELKDVAVMTADIYQVVVTLEKR
ncbi:MAG: methyltransferase domain-containing protein [Solirubrobacterales bacterium]|nr:methyltransferase domain-containing protein [Solirubrobacterales bacterium]MCB8914379.1 methyltransferase domain-containing protein [Thermoleophilales bacterium]